MKTLALVLFACVAAAGYAQSKNALPKDGNGLLDACSTMVTLADDPTTPSSRSQEQLLEKSGEFNWCAGYLDAMQDLSLQNHINLPLIAVTKVTLAGDDKAVDFAFKTLRGPCIPDQATILQLGRVLVKWLKEHPERLHEPKISLTTDALRDAFPCNDTPPKAAAKQ